MNLISSRSISLDSTIKPRLIRLIYRRSLQHSKEKKTSSISKHSISSLGFFLSSRIRIQPTKINADLCGSGSTIFILSYTMLNMSFSNFLVTSPRKRFDNSTLINKSSLSSEILARGQQIRVSSALWKKRRGKRWPKFYSEILSLAFPVVLLFIEW